MAPLVAPRKEVTMLASMFPRAYARYTSLPVLGGHLEGLCVWLYTQGYPRDAIQRRIGAAASLDRALRRRRIRSLDQLTASELHTFAPPPRPSSSPPQGALVRSLVAYLEERGELTATPTGPTERRVADYRRHLQHVRGLSVGTITMHAATITGFLQSLGYDADPQRLRQIDSIGIEAFISMMGTRVGRSRLGQISAVLRSFLRFLAITGEIPAGLDAMVDSPCIWRGERLPRALPWDTVRTFLRSIDRSTPKGRRDFAMFLLIATYGLRTCEVAALDLDGIAWETGQICVPRPKLGTPLMLPLTDEVGSALLAYLRQGRPASTHRRVFLRVVFPLGPLGRGAIRDAFRTWARRAGISLPVRGGPHCLRHSLALHLLREGTPLKTIGDILGHRTAEATGVYLRLDIDDLRDVALPLPTAILPQLVLP